MKKRLVFLCAMILLMALFTSSVASAATYAFIFEKTNSTKDTPSGRKLNGDTTYSFTINSGGTISSTNVLDARPRATDGSAAGSLYYYTSSGPYSHSYYSTHHDERIVFMRMEKSGSKSTSATPLEVSGTFTP